MICLTVGDGVYEYCYGYTITKSIRPKWLIPLEVVLVWIGCMHQSRKAAYTFGEVLLCLFKVVWLCWCASSPACTGWWYAGAGLVPSICLDPEHDQSPAHALPERILGCLLSSWPVGAHAMLQASSCLSNVRFWAPITRHEIHDSFLFFHRDLGVLASAGEFSWGRTPPWPPGVLGHPW